MKALIRNKLIYIEDKKIEINSLFSVKTIENANSCADNYNYNICVVNELYEEFVLPLFDIEKFIQNNFISEVEINNVDLELLPVILCACNRNNVYITGKWRFDKILWKTKINRVATFAYLFLQQLKQKFTPINPSWDAVAFIRSKSARQKFQKIQDIDKFDEIMPGIGSIFQQVKKGKRILLLFKAIKLTKKYENTISNYLLKYNMSECIPYSKYYYSKRLIHTAYYYLIQDDILKKNNWTTLYTGNNLDRFAVNEEALAKKHRMRLICIPHGIEYGYKFPKCFVGDLFYTTSENAAKELNKLYHTKKFQFYPEIGEIMFNLDNKNIRNIKVVYFSEPREFEVNIKILRKLIMILSKKEIKLYLKLHPVDNPDNYKEVFDLGINEIKDFKTAVCGNICVSRKSTTLLEATYNDSIAVAILITEKDRCIFQSFPSLSDDRIIRFDDIERAGEFIVKSYYKKREQDKLMEES